MARHPRLDDAQLRPPQVRRAIGIVYGFAAPVVVLVAIPGVLPFWMNVEQVVCGALLLAVIIIVNGRTLRPTLSPLKDTVLNHQHLSAISADRS